MGGRGGRAAREAELEETGAQAALRVGLDTSIVVRLLTGEPAESAAVAGQRIEAARAAGSEIVVSDLVLAESYFALQHHYGASKQGALDALRDLLRATPIRALGAAATILEQRDLATSKPGFVDRLLLAEYRRQVDETWTFERAAGRRPGVRWLRGAERA